MKASFIVLLVSLMLGACGKSSKEREFMSGCTRYSPRSVCECIYDELDLDDDDELTLMNKLNSPAASAVLEKCRR